MTRCSQRARYEFIHLLMKHAEITPATVTADNPKVITEGDIRWIAERLLYYGATLGRIAENQCNGYQTWDYKWDEAAAKKDEAKEERINKRVEKLCAMIGCKPIFGGDPRGNTLKIQVPDGFTNDWGKEGICVPTS
jgi:hypothetical protein